jgi:hypothetical protein
MNNAELSKLTGLEWRNCNISGHQKADGNNGHSYWLCGTRSGKIALTVEKKFHDVTHPFDSWQDAIKFINNKEKANAA